MAHAAPSTVEEFYQCKLASLSNLIRAIRERDQVMADHYAVAVADDIAQIAIESVVLAEWATEGYYRSQAYRIIHTDDDPFTVTQETIERLDQTIDLLTLIEELSKISDGMGHPIDSVENIATAKQSVKNCKASIGATWPIDDPEIVNISRSNHRSGRARNAEDVFSELLTQDS